MQEKKFTPPPVLLNTLQILWLHDEKGNTILEKIINNSLTEEDCKLLNEPDFNSQTLFKNCGQSTVESYDDYNYKAMHATQDFANFISPYLSDLTLFQLIDKLLTAELCFHTDNTILRNNRLVSSLLQLLVKRLDPNGSTEAGKVNQKNQSVTEIRKIPDCIAWLMKRIFDAKVFQLTTTQNVEAIKIVNKSNTTDKQRLDLCVNFSVYNIGQIFNPSYHEQIINCNLQINELNLNKNPEKDFKNLRQIALYEFTLKFSQLCQSKNFNEKTFIEIFSPIFPFESRQNLTETLKKLFYLTQAMLNLDKELFQACKLISQVSLGLINEETNKINENSFLLLTKHINSCKNIFEEIKSSYFEMLQLCPNEFNLIKPFKFVCDILNKSQHANDMIFTQYKIIIQNTLQAVSELKKLQTEVLTAFAEQFKTAFKNLQEMLGEPACIELQIYIYNFTNEYKACEALEPIEIQKILTFIKLDQKILKQFVTGGSQNIEETSFTKIFTVENKSPSNSPRNTNGNESDGEEKRQELN